jgi:hypothetical protein
MADEQPNTPSAPAPSDAASAAPPSESSAQEPTEDRSWWHRLLRRPEPNVDVQAGSDGDTEAARAGKPSPTVTLSQEELERRVQAETDRREARRQQQMTAEQRRRLRDEDPYAYAEQERQAEAAATYNQQYTAMLGQVGTLHDRAAIDPLVMALVEGERNRIMALEGAGVGLDGRRLVVSEALKALEKKWKADGARDAEAKLRRNSTFRKQVFTEHRGAYQEPELLPSSGREDAGGGDVSALLRRSIGRG